MIKLGANTLMLCLTADLEALDTFGHFLNDINDLVYGVLVEFASPRAVLKHSCEIAHRAEQIRRLLFHFLRTITMLVEAAHQFINFVRAIFQFSLT